ncbi:MAG TPA: hypothetical protein VF941_03120 [Clostridia bacterium]
MEILSQQDPRFANIKLGFSAYYIWAKGCFVTEIAQALGLTPDAVNEKLKAVNGFASDGTKQADGSDNLSLVIWDKIKEAFPGWTATYFPNYDNAAVLKNLEEGNKVLVEVSAAPIGGDGLHCVMYIGGQECYNCWPNPAVKVPTSTFPDVKAYVVLQQTPQAATDADTVTPTSVDPSSNQPVAGEDVSKLPTGWPTTYQGLDMTNLDSIKAAIDSWRAVANGEYVSASEYVNFRNGVTNALGIDTNTSLPDIEQNISALKADFAKSVQNSLTPAPSQIEGSVPSNEVAQIPHTALNLVTEEKDKIINTLKGLLGL